MLGKEYHRFPKLVELFGHDETEKESRERDLELPTIVVEAKRNQKDSADEMISICKGVDISSPSSQEDVRLRCKMNAINM
jgi:hypothetical protein